MFTRYRPPTPPPVDIFQRHCVNSYIELRSCSLSGQWFPAGNKTLNDSLWSVPRNMRNVLQLLRHLAPDWLMFFWWLLRNWSLDDHEMYALITIKYRMALFFGSMCASLIRLQKPDWPMASYDNVEPGMLSQTTATWLAYGETIY